jgi:hypothetical protein
VSAADDEAGRVKPTDRGWNDAKRDMDNRNDQARKAGKARQVAHERRISALKRDSKAER